MKYLDYISEHHTVDRVTVTYHMGQDLALRVKIMDELNDLGYHCIVSGPARDEDGKFTLFQMVFEKVIHTHPVKTT